MINSLIKDNKSEIIFLILFLSAHAVSYELSGVTVPIIVLIAGILLLVGFAGMLFGLTFDFIPLDVSERKSKIYLRLTLLSLLLVASTYVLSLGNKLSYHASNGAMYLSFSLAFITVCNSFVCIASKASEQTLFITEKDKSRVIVFLRMLIATLIMIVWSVVIVGAQMA